jgi:hypothetical protein
MAVSNDRTTRGDRHICLLTVHPCSQASKGKCKSSTSVNPDPSRGSKDELVSVMSLTSITSQEVAPFENGRCSFSR